MKKGMNLKAIRMAGVLSLALMLSGCQNLNTDSFGTKGTPASGSIDTSEIAHLLTNGGKTLETLCAETSILRLNVEEEGTIEIQDIEPDTVLYRLLYTSSDDRVCTVKQNGTVLGIGEGKATITVQDTISGLSAKVVVLVSEVPKPESISLSQTEAQLTEGENITLLATVIPEEFQETAVLWSSSDDSIATVDSAGVVTGVKEGSCVITVSVQADDTIKAEARIQVTGGEDENTGGNSGSQGSGNTQGSNGGNNNSGNNNGNNSNGNNSSGNNSSGNNSGSVNNGGTTSGSGGSGSGTAGSTASPYYMDSYAEQVLGIVNARRQEAGLAPLTMNYTLVNAAKVRAVEITQSFSHTRPDGRSCFTAFDEAGVGYSGAGENIAAGQWSPDSVMNSWMNSEGHRANIMDPNFTQIGIACYYSPDSDYGYYWVQCFIN